MAKKSKSTSGSSAEHTALRDDNNVLSMGTKGGKLLAGATPIEAISGSKMGVKQTGKNYKQSKRK
jgi:hypothetical protein